MTHTNAHERRRRRSPWTGEALYYQLDDVAMRERLVALVVADGQGFLVAASHRSDTMEELAAVAPMAARRAGLGPGEVAAERFLPAAVGRVDVEGAPVYLFAVGERRRACAAVSAAATGVRRILSAGLRIDDPALGA
jgi:hypothetical protein